MTAEPSPRQVIYALVAAGFLVVVGVLVTAAALTGLVPSWWTATLVVTLLAAGLWTARSWRRTGPVLAVAVGLFLVWAVGTLLLA